MPFLMSGRVQGEESINLTCAKEPLLGSEPWNPQIESDSEEGENEVGKKARRRMVKRWCLTLTSPGDVTLS